CTPCSVPVANTWWPTTTRRCSAWPAHTRRAPIPSSNSRTRRSTSCWPSMPSRWRRRHGRPQSPLCARRALAWWSATGPR
ncbi:MAG: hypothetical protein AVDCRST_MAG88-457, partial [uncultured Thermomicrobiales bacterium]